jgi:flagellar biosynthesis GTPase FlhF
VSDKNVAPTNDLLFRKLLSSEENKDILKGLLHDFFDMEVPLEDISILNPYNIRNFKEWVETPDGEVVEKTKMRSTITDVKVSVRVLDVILELQVYQDKYYILRAIYYTFTRFCENYNVMGHMECDEVGKPLRYSSLKPIYSLNIIAKNAFPQDDDALRVLTLNDRDLGIGLDKDWIKIAFFELRKNTFKNKNQQYWQEFFRTGQAPEGAPEYIQKSETVVAYQNLTKEEQAVLTTIQREEDKYISEMWTFRQGVRQEEQAKAQKREEAVRQEEQAKAQKREDELQAKAQKTQQEKDELQAKAQKTQQEKDELQAKAQREKADSAVAFYQSGFPIEAIAQCLKMPIEEVRNLVNCTP